MSPIDYSNFSSVQKNEKFQTLRSTHRKFAFPMTVVFLLWYLGFVVFAAFFPALMGISVLGNINLGIVLGLTQFVTTFIITGLYVYYANRKIDPLATDLRERMEDAGALGTTLSGSDDTDLATSGQGAGE